MYPYYSSNAIGMVPCCSFDCFGDDFDSIKTSVGDYYSIVRGIAYNGRDHAFDILWEDENSMASMSSFSEYGYNYGECELHEVITDFRIYKSSVFDDLI